MNVEVTTPTLEDAAAIAAVHVRSWQVGYAGLMPEDYLSSLSVERRTESWQKIIAGMETGSYTVLVAKQDSKIIGFCSVGSSRDEGADKSTGEVRSIYVDPDAWRAGAGSKMIAAATSYLKEQGYHAATLWVLSSNERARSFYERHDWQLDGFEKVDSSRGFDLHEVRYAIELGS